MPLIRNSPYNNPIALALPAAPNPALAVNLAPAQGDHLFGDVLGTIETALQNIFGGGAAWTARMSAYNATMRTVWDGMQLVDYGHGALPPVVNRAGATEPDEHAHVFGGYSQRLQWQLCEIVSTGFNPPPIGGEVRSIGGYSRAWKNSVLENLDELLAHLVDDTALRFYIATPNAIRAAAPLAVRHVAVSLAAANAYAAAHAGPGRARVQAVLLPYANLRSSVEGLISRFEGNIKTLNTVNDTWA